MTVDSHYVRMGGGSQSHPLGDPGGSKAEWIFEELPKSSIVNVQRSDDISHIQYAYTIEFKYKQFQWRLEKKAIQLLILHFLLKKRAIFEELQEKQEQIKEWVQSLGLGEQTPLGLSAQIDDETECNPPARRDVPSRAALPVMRPALGRSLSISQKVTLAMQNYLCHFLGSLEILNTREVCKFLEVSKLSFAREYGPKKLKEGYVMVQHLTNIHPDADSGCSFWRSRCCCCNRRWQKVWAVLKPGFLALLADPFISKPADIIVFDVLAPSCGTGDGQISLAKLTRERNPLHSGFIVTCGNRMVQIRTSNARDWVTEINDAGLRPPEGWCHPHRFGSFAPPRGLSPDSSEAQWFVDGRAAFEAIASAIEDAKLEIFIADWWLCPELYMRRPFGVKSSSRLDSLLEAKAKKGVQIYVLLYKEVALALKLNSMFTKRRLLSIHENIKVLRFPDHFSSGVYLWSHHEKIVVVDQQICFLGGLDLCFGRYDTPEHRVYDSPAIIWPGKDYYNPRESEPNSWEEAMKDEIDRKKLPRMPWHDVHIALWGPACRDVARHFVQRWNYAKRHKAPTEEAIPLLLPHYHMVLPHYLTGSEDRDAMIEAEAEYRKVSKPFSPSSKSPFQDIPLLLPAEDVQNANSIRYHSESGINETSAKIWNENRLNGHCSTSKLDADEDSLKYTSKRRNLSSSEMQMHDFVDGTDDKHYLQRSQIERMDECCTATIDLKQDKEWWELQERDGQRPIEVDVGEVGPRISCQCQVCSFRSVGQWSAGTSQLEEQSIHAAYCTLIEKSEHFIYIENQFFISGMDGDDIIHNRVLQALFSRIMCAYKEKQCFRVIVVLPLLPGFQGGVDDAGAASVRALMHWQYRTICRGKSSILERLNEEIGPQAENYLSFYGLRNHGRLYEGGPLATSQVYVHSKLMIIDDKVVLLGSANLNDRSLLGSRDSEIGVIIEDVYFVDSFMNLKYWKAGKFARSLRLSLWAEHLGLSHFEVQLIEDPICDATYKDMWMSRAKMNTRIYDAVFGCIPNDHIHSRAALRHAALLQKERANHATIDLGIAPELLKENSSKTEESIASNNCGKCLLGIRGHVVCYPVQFMLHEDLRPVFNESEYYTLAQVFQ
ncbi:hypothetical protein O6H91_18G004000 [Diphasiastrum complanatum]|uniref:Uncharacterized protein n=1 Tax=Diphasiastrum complanatum TaxID=34168 RepID=A0ACC2AXR1_DIPCM|nr:hypothetical protein O6H91_18G004000 [Diphasiastrum complanatum]